MKLKINSILFIIPVIFCAVEIKSSKMVDFDSNLLYEVSKYLDKPYESLGTLNKRIKRTYTDGQISLVLLSERLNMPEIVSIDVKGEEEDVNEVLGMLSLDNRPKVLFKTLFKALRNRHICPTLQTYLLKYLRNIFNQIDQNEIENLRKEFDLFCANLLAYNDEFKLLLEWFGDNHDIFVNNANNLSHEKKKKLYLEIINNESIINSYERILRNLRRNHDLLFADAIIHNVPESIYRSISVSLTENLFNYFNVNLSADESEIVHEKLNRVIEEVQDQRLKNRFNILNDIRFGSADDIDNDDFRSLIYGTKSIVYLLKIVHQGHKRNLFKRIILHYSKMQISECLDSIASSTDFYFIKVYFDILEILGQNVKRFENFNALIVIFLKQNCVLTDIKKLKNGNLFEVTFKPSSVLLNFAYPEELKMILDTSKADCSHFIPEFWKCIKTESSEKLKELVAKFFTISRVKRYVSGIKAAKRGNNYNPIVIWRHETCKDFKDGYEYGLSFGYIAPSYETALMVLENISLKYAFNSNEIKVILKPDVISQLIKHSVSFNFAGIKYHQDVILTVLKYAKTRAEIARLELLSGKNIAEIFLCKNSDYEESFYYEYRHGFIYWINGPHKTRIKELESASIKEILSLEYPKIMEEILL